MRIAIIGAGAAGLMAAASALESDQTFELHLIERNAGIGRKLLLTGGGRCNLTTGFDDMRVILAKYPRGGRFLNSALRIFPPAAARSWFERHGIALKTEADGRVFPQSDDGQEVIDMFARLLDDPRMRLHVSTTVDEVSHNGDEFVIKRRGRPAIKVDRLIITTGGQAYRQTGSMGDGYTFASALGHAITPLAPSLSQLKLVEDWPKRLAGVSWSLAKLTAGGDSRLVTEGPFLFTHHGLTGPAVFALSSLVAQLPWSAAQPLPIWLDLFPQLTVEELRQRFVNRLEEQPRRTILNALTALPLPRSLAQVALECVEQPPMMAAGQVGREIRRRLPEMLKRWEVHANGRLSGEEFVTAGGVELKEVNPSTMESKICPGLFLAGEVLDIDGFTGGFNLQAAWATGRLAGQRATEDAGSTSEAPKKHRGSTTED